MSDGAYSPDKALYWPDRLESLRNGNHPAPVHVQLILSDWCPQDCDFCAYRQSGYSSNQLFNDEHGHNPKRFMPTEKAIEIIDDCAEIGVRGLQMTGGGESSAHKDFAVIMAHAQAMGLSTALVTNGILLQDRGLIPVVSKTVWTRISIDAGTRETYVKIRRCPNIHWDKAWSSIKVLCQQNPRPVVGVGFVVTKDNYMEIEDFARMARDSGVDNIRLSGVFQNAGAGYFDSFFHEAAVLCARAEALSSNMFKVHNRFSEKVKDLEEASPDYSYCGYQRFTTYIAATMQVFRCCIYAYNTRGLLGSVANQRFKDLWFSEDVKKNFDGFNAKQCERCQFSDRNRSINLMLKKPDHPEFV